MEIQGRDPKKSRNLIAVLCCFCGWIDFGVFCGFGLGMGKAGLWLLLGAAESDGRKSGGAARQTCRQGFVCADSGIGGVELRVAADVTMESLGNSAALFSVSGRYGIA